MTSIEEALRSGAVRGVLADWSALPNDLYVTEVRTNDGIVFDATLCSVPMAIGPEVRYSRADTKRCEHCDGTGDVHSIGGEWRGRCTCPAGAALSAAPDHTPALLALIEERDGAVSLNCDYEEVLTDKRRLARELDEALGVLAGLSSYFGAGLGDDATTAEQFDRRIREGIEITYAPMVEAWRKEMAR